MEKLIRQLYQPYKFLVVLPLTAAATIFFGALIIVLSSVISQRADSIAGHYMVQKEVKIEYGGKGSPGGFRVRCGG